jgi:hypothetical protein
MAFRIRPVFFSGRWSPLLTYNYRKYFVSCKELSSLTGGGSRVCLLMLCRFLNLPITDLAMKRGGFEKQNFLNTWKSISKRMFSFTSNTAMLYEPVLCNAIFDSTFL